MKNEKHERYIIDEQEIELLDRYEGLNYETKEERYDSFPQKALVAFCMMKDRLSDTYIRRYNAAREVIDLIAKQVGIDPDNTGYMLYIPEADGTTPIVRKMEEWFSRSGEKAQLKRRLQELEQENTLLRSLIQK